MLSFLHLFFAYETEFFWKSMHPPRGIWIPHYACAHWSFQNSGRCRCTPRGMVVEVWFPPPGPSDGREKNQAKKISNDKTRHWLRGKTSKRHNFRYTEWNHALQKEICSFKYNLKNWGRGFNLSLWYYTEFLPRQLNAASPVYLEKYIDIKLHVVPTKSCAEGGICALKDT